MDNTIILEVQNLKKVFNNDLLKKPVTAIYNVNCSFVRGTINTIIGHNGAGKTTTLRIILGLLRQDSGHVLYEGQPIARKHFSNIGYMPEIHRLSGSLTPYETLKCHLRYYRKPRALANDLIEQQLRKLQVWTHRKKKVRELSKGLQRRLAYCLATIHEPKFLILDEPFAGLDPLGHELMEQLLIEQREQNHTILMSSHDVDSMVKLCDHYHVFRGGTSVYSSLDHTQLTQEQTPRYEVQISGLDRKDLEQLFQEDTSLTPADSWSQDDFHHCLVFPSYKDALGNIRFLLDKGIVVSGFQSLGRIEKYQILHHYSDA